MKLPAEDTKKRERMVRHYARLAQDDIRYCTNCQPFDGGEWAAPELLDTFLSGIC
jgi:predicted Rdx family selenoprotein